MTKVFFLGGKSKKSIFIFQTPPVNLMLNKNNSIFFILSNNLQISINF